MDKVAQHDAAECEHHEYTRYDEPELLFYLAAGGFFSGIKIQPQHGAEGNLRVDVLVPQALDKELAMLRDKVKATRTGDMVWSACYGAPHNIRQLIEQDQVYLWPGCEKYNETPKVSQQALDECFVRAYQRVDGYRPYGNDGPVLDTLYNSLREQGIRPIDPEGMVILLHNEIGRILSRN